MNKVFSQAVQLFHLGSLNTTALADIFGRFHTTPHRAREKAHIGRRFATSRDNPAQTKGLLPPTLRQTHVGTVIRILWRDMVPFTVPHQQANPLVGSERFKEVLGAYKIVCHYV